MSVFTVKFTSTFKKDYRRAIKQGRDITRLDEVIALLASGRPLPENTVTISCPAIGTITVNAISSLTGC